MEQASCYQLCNQRYPAMAPGRLFCKKGCDSEESLPLDCKKNTCNKVCIKSEQGEQHLFFKFLNRAPVNPDECLEACVQGCNQRPKE